MRLLAFLLCQAVFLLVSTAYSSDFPAEIISRLGKDGVFHPMAAEDGRISLHVDLPADQNPRQWGLLPLVPGLASVRLPADQIDDFIAARPGLRFGWHPPLRPRLDRSTAWSKARIFQSKTGFDGKGVVVGIIDTGIDVTHPDLRHGDGTTRVAWLLDMSRSPTGRHPDIEEDFGCQDASLGGCAVFDAADIDESIATSVGIARDQVGHGTHVTSIAAGNGLGSQDARLAGMAPGATIIAARVTRGGGEDISDVDTLSAARFIFERAQAMGMPAVLSISLGVDFGPHDGSSWLERGLASFVGPDQPGRAIVVAAGNSGGLYVEQDSTTYGIHTQTRVYPNTRVRVPMKGVGMQDPNVKGTVYVWMTWKPDDNVAVGLEGPDGKTWIDPIPRGVAAQFESTSLGSPVRAVVLNDYRGEGSPIPVGTTGAVMLVDGSWPSDERLSILLEGDGIAEFWLQGMGGAGVTGLGLGMMFERGMKENTVNVPATHPLLIAVGASINRTSWKDAQGMAVAVESFGSKTSPLEDSIAYFSGCGPTSLGIPKPEITAPGVFVAAAMSRDADPSTHPLSMFAAAPSTCPEESIHCLVVDEHHAIATGTSMAAPAVAGALALLLSMDSTLTSPELIGLLQAGSRWPMGEVPFPYQMGPGLLDLQGALESYELMGRPMLREPDADRSWVVMASSFARPDPTHPVCGYVETRMADGSLADGFDEGLLSVHLQSGVVTQPLTRVAPGMRVFCVAAPSGSGGKTMRIEVRYRDEPLGTAQYLPIGSDPFVAADGIVAFGGCSMNPASATGWRVFGFMYFLVVVFASRRLWHRGFWLGSGSVWRSTSGLG